MLEHVFYQEQTNIYLNFKGNHPRFNGENIRGSSIICIPKIGYHTKSLPAGTESPIYVLLIFHINTSYLFLVCEVFELAWPDVKPTILGYYMKEKCIEDEIKNWAYESLLQRDNINKGRVIEISGINEV
jgi:hypothetical protein